LNKGLIAASAGTLIKEPSERPASGGDAATSVALLVDANQYLALYGLASGRKLLDLLHGQRNRIFVSTQIVDEVTRNKLKLASRFFAAQFEKGKIIAVPDHLLGVDGDKIKELRDKFALAESARKEINDIALDVLTKISRAEDDVSIFLRSLFDKAVAPSTEQIARAQSRRERGNPPGKLNDPLGDQIYWEQFLDHCRKNKCKDVWIITGDTDYHVKYDKKLLLNPLLNRDLVSACDGQPEVHCFDTLLDALTKLGEKEGLPSARLPTSGEAKQLKQEFDYWKANTIEKSIVSIFDANLQRIISIPAANAAWVVNEAFWHGPPKDDEGDKNKK
jgi:hypothetical protein